MPGVKDRRRRRLVRFGKIRLGHKETRSRQDGSTYEVPVQDDHFLLHDAQEIADFYFAEQGSEVRRIDVILPYADVGRNFETSYQLWAGGVLVCEGDGEFVHRAEGFKTIRDNSKIRIRNAPGGTRIANGVAKQDFDWGNSHFCAGDMDVPCSGKDQDLYEHCTLCRLSCTLRVMMSDPRLFRFGYYEIHTGGGRNYETILGTLETFPNQDLRGIPFTLRMVQGITSYEDKNGQRHKKEMSFIELEPEKTMTRELYGQHIARKLGRGPVEQQVPALPETAEPLDDIQEPPPPDEPESQPEPQEPVAIPEMPPELAGKDPTEKVFLELAESTLGFPHIGAVMMAMKAGYGDEWKYRIDIPSQEAWSHLATHKELTSD